MSDLNDDADTIARIGTVAKNQESRDAQKVLRLLAKRLKPLGFERTKPTFFTRPGKFVVEFVHVHKFTFGPIFCVYFGIRVRADEHPGATLNGPVFEGLSKVGPPSAARKFHFRPDAKAIATCADFMGELVATAGAEWFKAMGNTDLLLSVDTSPLRAETIAALQRSLNSPENVVTSPQTRDALNID